MRKYFFGYQAYNGIYFPLMWEEHDGVTIGPKMEIYQKHELTLEEYDSADFKTLELKYPLVRPEKS